MELYVRDGCQYCHRVLEAAEELHISLELHNIADPAIADGLLARGGKVQVPYLVDSKNGTEMYESEDIVAYLKGQVSATKINGGNSAA